MKYLSWLIGREEDRDLPPFVRDQIAAQQDRSERLIGWIQLGIVLFFALLYLGSPKTAFDHKYSYLTPLAIGIYFVLTVNRLVMSYRSRMGFWLLAGSVLIDIGLLYGLIWSFHLQYDQPASFYLKAPTLLYIFIFIALRALRFEARYVFLMGISAAIGWLMMAGYAIFVDRYDDMITHDYVRYMTSNSVLIGAEIDKVISILVVTLLLAIALHRARVLMTRSIAESYAKQNLSRFFSPEVAKQISDSGGTIMAGNGEARDAAILNLDVRGFTKMAAVKSPQDVVKLLAEYQGAMVPIIQRHGGSIDKFMGDGIMATFGATTPMADYAARSLDALEECIEVAHKWTMEQMAKGAPDLKINGAVAAGRVICGAVGDKSRLEYTVIGDAVNLSAKLEKHNKSLGSQAIVSKETYELAKQQGFEAKAHHRFVERSEIGGAAEAIALVILA